MVSQSEFLQLPQMVTQTAMAMATADEVEVDRVVTAVARVDHDHALAVLEMAGEIMATMKVLATTNEKWVCLEGVFECSQVLQ